MRKKKQIPSHRSKPVHERWCTRKRQSTARPRPRRVRRPFRAPVQCLGTLSHPSSNHDTRSASSDLDIFRGSAHPLPRDRDMQRRLATHRQTSNLECAARCPGSACGQTTMEMSVID